MNIVLEKNPPKQGLKQTNRTAREFYESKVLEKNPPKQGLKQDIETSPERTNSRF